MHQLGSSKSTTNSLRTVDESAACVRGLGRCGSPRLLGGSARRFLLTGGPTRVAGRAQGLEARTCDRLTLSWRGSRFDDGERVGAKVVASKSATNFGRLYYTCGFAKVNGSRAGLGGFRCVTSEKRWIAWVRDADVANERDRVVY